MSLVLRLAGAALSVLLAVGQAGASEKPNVVITVNRVIYPGQTVTADAVMETPLVRPVAGNIPVIREASAIVGKIADRTILPKRLISPDSLREAYAVEAGQTTTVYYRQGGLVIAMDAVALESAGLNSPVKVRNQESGRTITGVVMPDGTVSVEAR